MFNSKLEKGLIFLFLTLGLCYVSYAFGITKNKKIPWKALAVYSKKDGKLDGYCPMSEAKAVNDFKCITDKKIIVLLK